MGAGALSVLPHFRQKSIRYDFGGIDLVGRGVRRSLCGAAFRLPHVTALAPRDLLPHWLGGATPQLDSTRQFLCTTTEAAL